MDQNQLVFPDVEPLDSPGSRRPQVAAVSYPAQNEGGCSHAVAPPRKKGQLAFLWGISGTVLSAVGFLAVTLFEQYNESVTELQRDLKHFNEVSADLVKKESMQRCREQIKECLKEMQASAVLRAQLERDLQTSEQERKELAMELQRLRERVAAVEGRQAATPIILPAAHPEK
jgi:hypothetical protein